MCRLAARMCCRAIGGRAVLIAGLIGGACFGFCEIKWLARRKRPMGVSRNRN